MQTPDPSAINHAGAATGAVEAGGAAVSRRWKPLIWVGGVLAALVLLIAGTLFGLIYFNLESNPLVGRFVRDRLVATLQDRIDPALRLDIGSVDLKREASETLVRLTDFTIRNSEGRALVSAPTGRVTLSSGALARLSLAPTDVQLDGLRVAVEVDETGALAIGSPDAPVEPTQGETSAATEPPVDMLRQVIGSGFAGFAAMRDAVGGRLPQIGVNEAAVTVRDRRTGKIFALSGISTTMASQPNGAARGRAEVKMRDIAFAVGVEVAVQEGGRQTFAARTENLQLADILGVLGISLSGIDTIAPVAMTVTAEVDKDMKPRAASAGLTIGKTRISPGKEAEAFTVDSLAASLSWTEGDKAIAIPRASLAIGDSKVALSGDLVPPEVAEGGWRIRLAGKDQLLEGIATGDKPVEVANVQVQLLLFPHERRLAIEQASVAGPKMTAEAQGEAMLDAAMRPGLKLSVTARDADVRTALRFWPVHSAPETRGFLVTNLKGGQLAQLQLALDFPPDVMALALADKPVPEKAVTIRFSGSRAVLQAIKGMPPVRDLNGSGIVTGRTARLDVASAFIETGPGRRVSLSDVQFYVADTTRKPADARLQIRFSGTAEALADLLRQPALQPYAPRVTDPQSIKGTGEGEAVIQLRMVPVIQPQDVKVSISANLRNVTVEKALGNDRIENGTFQISTERDVTTLKGEARVFGTPASIEVRSVGRGQSMATMTLTLDDAARARKGIALGAMLTGPILVKLTAPLGENDAKDVMAEVDFVRAAVAELVPGWSKKAGAPGKAKARLAQVDGGWLIDRLEMDAGTLSLRGAVNVGADGAFQKAQLSSFKLSAGDNVQLDADRAGGLTRINIRGNAFDVRPFLRSLQTGAIDKSGARDTEVNLRTTVLSGFGGELISNADLKLLLRGTDLRRFDMTGRFDRGPVTAKMQAKGNQQPILTVETEDAGAFLRFLDIYSRMRGGDMVLTVAIASGTQTGAIHVKDFALRNEPAMKRLVTDVTANAPADSTRIAPEVARRLAQSTDVSFTKMTASFARTPGRLDVKESVMWGAEIGGSLAGSMDYVRDRVDLTGTFVPAYSLNNMFSQVPVLGPLLGGGRNEGLFAVRYNITGKISAPTLSINPLTAIAPGFLRKLIDFRGAGGEAPAATPRHEQ